ncbi:MAG: YbaK/EbsC family protein [Candidatus Krumholzibacteriia bacterium]
MPSEKLLENLRAHGVDYAYHEHPKAYAAEDVAHKAGVPEREFAKTVLVKLDGLLAMAVLPAAFKVNFNLLREAAGARTVSLALEREFAWRFPDCAPGAMPPFGNLYDLPVYVDASLAEATTIAFNAGTHREIITMAWDDFETLVEPQLARFAYQPLKQERFAW